MNSHKYFELFKQISHLPLTSDKKEEKIRKLVYLINFTQHYKTPIKIIDPINYEFCIIEIESLKKGILFFEVKRSLNKDYTTFPNDIFKLQEFKRRANADELWFIFVKKKYYDL